MPGFLSKVFRGREAGGGGGAAGAGASSTSRSGNGKKNAVPAVREPNVPPKPRWEDAWARREVEPEEVQRLLRGCTTEVKSRALDIPFLLLPFRPASDPSAARAFVRSYFQAAAEGGDLLQEERLQQELRLTEPIVLCSVMKWCWSRLPGGVVTWEAYELFRVGEQDSNLARDSFATFIPLSIDSDARTKIIFDFFDLLASTAAHGKTNGLGGRKLSRLAAWWAFEQADTGDGFDGGYKAFMRAADATSHLFFAYLRSLSPETGPGISGLSTLPISLQTLLQATEYPPETPTLMQRETTKVVMIVDNVSPTPFSLLRRAKNFEFGEYGDEEGAAGAALQRFASADDPVDTLTEECRRVLRCISSANQSPASDAKASTSLRDPTWSRFEDIGFASVADGSAERSERGQQGFRRAQRPPGLSTEPSSRRNNDDPIARPTTPSWADFTSSGFSDEPASRGPAPLLLPPDKVLPPIETSRAQSSQSHRRAPGMPEDDTDLEPGELASIKRFSLDDTFWWVWMLSLADEEVPVRKAAFGRCTIIETAAAAFIASGAGWLVLEEQVKGAAPTPDQDAYLVEKKSRFTFRRRRGKQQQTLPKQQPPSTNSRPYHASAPISKTSIGPDQHARIQAAAAALQERQREGSGAGVGDGVSGAGDVPVRRGREDAYSTRTNSVLTLQPVIMSEAGPAMKWANKFDKDAIREAYLSNNTAAWIQQSSQPSQVTQTAATPTSEIATPVNPEKPPIQQEDHPALKQQANGHAKPAEVDATQVPLPDESVQPPRGASRQEDAPLALQKSTSPTTDRKKLQKGKKGGLKKMFRRKNTEPAAAAAAAPPPPVQLNETHQNSQGSVPSLSRRISTFRRKNASNVPVATPVETTPVPETPPAPPAPPKDEPVLNEPTIETQDRERDISTRVSSESAGRAERAFETFDQGPLESPQYAEDTQPKTHPVQPEHVPAETVAVSHPTDNNADYRVSDPQPEINQRPVTASTVSSVSKPSLDAQDPREGQAEPSPDPDARWAQIRKNAAERVATRESNSEDQQRPSAGRRSENDDGETSGEETIESRVARIKARVAELTGNMEGNNAAKVK